jgi:16S rRNA A1518/A1519 N6-dimethyltransferase RsmA/KsgA/DIM1 with predicted DNA glycosylase/AP lyase activity
MTTFDPAAIARYGNLPSEARVLEVGVGTGQATMQMVQAGWRVFGVEPGAVTCPR